MHHINKVQVYYLNIANQQQQMKPWNMLERIKSVVVVELIIHRYMDWEERPNSWNASDTSDSVTLLYIDVKLHHWCPLPIIFLQGMRLSISIPTNLLTFFFSPQFLLKCQYWKYKFLKKKKKNKKPNKYFVGGKKRRKLQQKKHQFNLGLQRYICL